MTMIRNLASRLLVLAAVFSGLNLATAQDALREHLSLDANWKFHLGDDWPNALHLDKAGSSDGPAGEKFSDGSWRTLNLPHDWAIELPFDSTADGSHGFKPVGPGFHQNSVGWYRRTFDLPATDAGKRIWLQFDGAFRDTTVWVNGWIIARNESGYYPFRADITDVAHFGGHNTVAVKVDASKFEGWFYEGAGIYRHVWLNKTGPVAIAPDGVFVYSQFTNNIPDGPAQLHAAVKLLNSAETPVEARVVWSFQETDGTSLGELNDTVQLDARSQKEISTDADGLQFTLPQYQLWSPESPKLYQMVTTVEVDGRPVDRVTTEFGIRTVGFDVDNGFLLNGQHYELKGTCNHQDMAGVGAALPDALQYYRIAKLKEFGCNAYRTSHNPPTPELLAACDHLGMIVMDECRLLGSDPENLRRWELQIRRDRNHPSVGIWSIANEEFYVQDTPQGANVARTMQALAQHLDPTRPETYAAPEGDNFAGVNSVIQVRGWNYHVGRDMDRYHAEHPTQPNVGTEQASTVSTRGIYANDPQRGYVSAYDDNAPSWATTTERWWSYFADRPWLSGGFVWTGFDYRGEPTPYQWPCINSHFGVLDVCGFPKDNYYYYQSWWTTNTVLHLLPHWNWTGKEGRPIRVDALSNCEQVELFLNGQSLGEQTMRKNSKLSWQVNYNPGTLSAKGYVGGVVVAETKVETTGDASAVQLTPDRATINADGEDVSVFTVAVIDGQGRIVPTAGNKINFTLAGPGKILGVGNGDPSCHEPDTYVAQTPFTTIPVGDWRWKLAPVPAHGEPAPEYAAGVDDSAWNRIKPKTDGDTGSMFLQEGQTAIYRAHVTVTAAELAGKGLQLVFGGIDDHGWVFVNNQFVGESTDWAAQPAYEVKPALHEGDNLIAVGVLNASGTGGLNPEVNLVLTGQPVKLAWSRSAFNGLAQIMVQSSKDAGDVTLTATADGLQPATATVTTQPAPPPPSVP